MKLLLEKHDAINPNHDPNKIWSVHHSLRIILQQDFLIAVLRSLPNGTVSLPGCSMVDGGDIQESVARLAVGICGLSVKIVSHQGVIMEYKTLSGEVHITSCFTAIVESGPLMPDKYPDLAGAIEWLSPQKVHSLLERQSKLAQQAQSGQDKLFLADWLEQIKQNTV